MKPASKIGQENGVPGPAVSIICAAATLAGCLGCSTSRALDDSAGGAGTGSWADSASSGEIGGDASSATASGAGGEGGVASWTYQPSGTRQALTAVWGAGPSDVYIAAGTQLI